MTTKEIVKELRQGWNDCGFIMEAADRLEELDAEKKRLLEALELLESEDEPSGTPVPTDDTEIGMITNTNDRT